MPEYLTIDECAKKFNVSRTIIVRCIYSGRVDDLDRIGNVWMIPKTWEYVPNRKGQPKKEKE